MSSPRREHHMQPRRVAMLTVHTSPLEQPGTGDAGGMNVYVARDRPAARRARRRGRHLHPRHHRRPPAEVEVAPGVLGPARRRRAPTRAWQGRPPGPALRLRGRRHAGRGAPGAGLVRPGALALLAVGAGRLARRRALGRPAGAHHAHHGPGQEPTSPTATPPSRSAATSARRRSSRPPTASSPTPTTRPRELSSSTAPTPARVASSRPGSTSPSSPPGDRGGGRARRRLGLPADGDVLLFVGRIQPLKAPDVLLRVARRAAAPPPRTAATRLDCRRPRRPERQRPGASRGPGGARRAARHRGRRPLPPSGRRGRSSPTGTAPPTSSPCPRTASRSGSSPSRRRPAARPWWPPTSAACRRPSATA